MPQYDDARFSPAAPVAKVILRVPNSDAPPAEALMLMTPAPMSRCCHRPQFPSWALKAIPAKFII